jgi:RNA polymerase sigma-70 factor (ECF subfamily)
MEGSQAQQRLLARYCDAFERYDVATLVSLLHEDAVMSMPPFPWWLHGRAEIRRALLAAGRPCEGARVVPTVANGSPAFAQYRPAGPHGPEEPFALTVIELSDGLIAEMTTYLDGERLFPLFGLPTGTAVVTPSGTPLGGSSGFFQASDEFPRAAPYYW